MKNRRGFTLIELTVAIIIVGILASLSVNAYVTMVERGRWAEAREVLLKAYAGYQRSLDETTPVVNNATFWTQLGMDISAMTSTKFVYSVLSATSVRADRLPGGAGNTWTIDLTSGVVTKAGNAPNF